MSIDKTKPWDEWIREQDDPRYAQKKPEALDGIVVLDVSRAHMGGCFAASLLAELGAFVIRVEPPGGDVARKFTPFGMIHKDTGLGYLNEGRNKYHITLNLDTEEGRELYRELAHHTDVIIETFKPGEADEKGIGYRQLSQVNPRLIYCAIYTYGQFGPEAEKNRTKPDYDVTDQARGGIMAITGEPDEPEIPEECRVPTKEGNWMGWYAGGCWAAYGVLVALIWRMESGKGQFIDVAPPEGLLKYCDYHIQWYHQSGKLRPRIGPYDSAVFPYTFVQTKDGTNFVSGFSDVNWAHLCNIMNKPEVKDQFPTIFDRLNPDNQPKIHHIIEEWSKNLTSQELTDVVMKHNLSPDAVGVVATAKVNKPLETLGEENWWIRCAFAKFKDPDYGELTIANPAFNRMTETPARVKWLCRPVGADNEFIFKKFLGYGASKLEELKKAGIV